MFRLKHGTWVLVADSQKALILENDGSAEHPQLVVRRERHESNPPNREQAANLPGRMNDGPRVQRSAMGDTDWHELQKHRFAVELAELLYQQAHDGHFEAIVLVASPQVLGEIRQQLHPEVTDRVIGEIPKVLTDQPVDKITEHVLQSLSEAD